MPVQPISTYPLSLEIAVFAKVSKCRVSIERLILM